MNFFTQDLCWEYYSKPNNLVVIQFIKYPNFEFKNLDNFQILTYGNYGQTNGIQLELFYTSPMLGILQQTEVGIKVIKNRSFEFKIEKKTKKCHNLEFFEC